VRITKIILFAGLACALAWAATGCGTVPVVPPDTTITAIRGYVGSAQCQSCHPAQHTEVGNSGHPYKLNAITGGKAPTYPHSTVPNTPADTTWNDVSFVIGGYQWKARFMDLEGYILTGDTNRQYNLEDPDSDPNNRWVGYDGSTAPRKQVNCGACHTTGWQEKEVTPSMTRAFGLVDLTGMTGTFTEPGVHCEACHGPGEQHANAPTTSNILHDDSAAMCGACHTRGESNTIPASGDAPNTFIRHHEQYNEFLASPHSDRKCVDCHDNHIGTAHGNADSGGIVATCTSCHSSVTVSHSGTSDCVTCHMPNAAKSARSTNRYVGDVQSHIFAINGNAVAKDTMFDGTSFVALTAGKAQLTLDMVCYQCHRDDAGIGGSNSQRTLQELSTKAATIHGSG